ncbi:MAG: TetR family transcriptional regulator [Hyphomicrobiales bacterium]|nr:MAG: TetR family transcriptional regulator [Hyphomicrobiales bacterium]
MSSSAPSRSAATRSREQTERRLKEAMEQLQHSGDKVSISAVAKAAQVTPALIHNTYPDIAERIRSVVGKSTRMQRDAKHEALVKEKERNRELRAEVERLRADAAKLASINLTLLSKLAVYEETGNGKVMSFAIPTIASR